MYLPRPPIRGSKVSNPLRSVAILKEDLPILELERETFDIMWEMSTPGGEAERCFLRAPQTEYYAVKEGNDLLPYPNVCMFYYWITASDFANLGLVATSGSFRVYKCTRGCFCCLFFYTQHQYACVSSLPSCTIFESRRSHCARFRSTHLTSFGRRRGGV